MSLKEQNKEEALADAIRDQARDAQIIPFTVLLSEDENAAELLEKISKDEAFNDIVRVKGDKDTYYYSNKVMSEVFATIMVFLSEGKHAHAMALTVRDRSKHKNPTPVRLYTEFPFFLAVAQIEQVEEIFKTDPEYADMKAFTASDGMDFFCSTLHMTPDDALALVEKDIEDYKPRVHPPSRRHKHDAE